MCDPRGSERPLCSSLPFSRTSVHQACPRPPVKSIINNNITSNSACHGGRSCSPCMTPLPLQKDPIRLSKTHRVVQHLPTWTLAQPARPDRAILAHPYGVQALLEGQERNQSEDVLQEPNHAPETRSQCSEEFPCQWVLAPSLCAGRHPLAPKASGFQWQCHVSPQNAYKPPLLIQATLERGTEPCYPTALQTDRHLSRDGARVTLSITSGAKPVGQVLLVPPTADCSGTGEPKSLRELQGGNRGR